MSAKMTTRKLSGLASMWEAKAQEKFAEAEELPRPRQGSGALASRCREPDSQRSLAQAVPESIVAAAPRPSASVPMSEAPSSVSDVPSSLEPSPRTPRNYKPPPPPRLKKAVAEPAPEEPKMIVVLRSVEPTPQPEGVPASIVPTEEEVAAAKAEAEAQALKAQLSNVSKGKFLTSTQLKKALRLAEIETTADNGEPLGRPELEALYKEHCSEEAMARREAATKALKQVPPRAEWTLALELDLPNEPQVVDGADVQFTADSVSALLKWYAIAAAATGLYAKSTLSFEGLSQQELDHVYHTAQGCSLATLTGGNGSSIQVAGAQVVCARDLTPAEGAAQAPLFALLGWMAASHIGALAADELLAKLMRRPASELPPPYPMLVEEAQRIQATTAGFGGKYPTAPEPAVGVWLGVQLEAAFQCIDLYRG